MIVVQVVTQAVVQQQNKINDIMANFVILILMEVSK